MDQKRGIVATLDRGLGHTQMPRPPFNLSGQGSAKSPAQRSHATAIAVVFPTFPRPEALQVLLNSLREGSHIPDQIVVVDSDPDRSAYPEAIDGLNVRLGHAGLRISLAGARNVGWRSTTVERDAVAARLAGDSPETHWRRSK